MLGLQHLTADCDCVLAAGVALVRTSARLWVAEGGGLLLTWDLQDGCRLQAAPLGGQRRAGKGVTYLRGGEAVVGLRRAHEAPSNTPSRPALCWQECGVICPWHLTSQALTG